MAILIGTVEDLEAAGLEFCGGDKKEGWWRKDIGGRFMQKTSSFWGAQVCTSDLNIYVNGPSGSFLMLYTRL